jgi:AGZA family xanthine/uracil permease-like MFS transporter
MFANPLVSFLPLAIMLATYFGKLRLPWHIPGGLAAVATGSVLAWIGGLTDHAAPQAALEHLGLYLPRPAVGEMISALDWHLLVAALPVIVPMGLINAMGTLQNIESAEAAGDRFEVGPTMVVNGLGTLLGAVLGSCFPTTVYIGHPGWKALGARSGYSIINGVFITVVCLTGAIGVMVALIPPESVYPVLLYIGVMMTSQAFEVVPKRHFPAVCVGLIPPIAAWGLLLVGFSLTVATGGNFDFALAGQFKSMLDFDLHGLMNLAGGFLFSAMFLTAITVHFIDQDFRRVIYWCLAAAGFAWFGLIHSGRIVAGQFTDYVAPGAGWKFSAGYGMIAAFALHCYLRQRKQKPGEING